MNADESTVRDLLAAAQSQPELLDIREVLVQGRRRRRRNILAPAVGVLLVAALAGGLVVVTQPHQGRTDVAQTVSVVPGEIERLDALDQTFGVAVRQKDADKDLFLAVFLPNGAGGWNEVSGGGVVDRQGPSIFFGNTQFPKVSFATLPAGSTSIAAVFSEQTSSQTNWVSVRGADAQIYVVVTVATTTPPDAARLLGLTWLDDQGLNRRYTPFDGWLGGPRPPAQPSIPPPSP